jgi:hypothetical protein
MPGGKPVISEEMSALESARANDVISLENIGDSWRNLDNEASNTNASAAPACSESKPPPQLAASVPTSLGAVPQERSNHTFTTSEGEDGDFDFKSNGVRSRWMGSRKFAALVVLVLIIGTVLLGTYTFSSSGSEIHHSTSSTKQLARRPGSTATQLQQPRRQSSDTSKNPPKQSTGTHDAPQTRRAAPSASRPAAGAPPGAAPAAAAAAAASSAAAQVAAAKVAKAAQLQRLAQAQQQVRCQSRTSKRQLSVASSAPTPLDTSREQNGESHPPIPSSSIFSPPPSLPPFWYRAPGRSVNRSTAIEATPAGAGGGTGRWRCGRCGRFGRWSGAVRCGAGGIAQEAVPGGAGGAGSAARAARCGRRCRSGGPIPQTQDAAQLR